MDSRRSTSDQTMSSSQQRETVGCAGRSDLPTGRQLSFFSTVHGGGIWPVMNLSRHVDVIIHDAPTYDCDSILIPYVDILNIRSAGLSIIFYNGDFCGLKVLFAPVVWP